MQFTKIGGLPEIKRTARRIVTGKIKKIGSFIYLKINL